MVQTRYFNVEADCILYGLLSYRGFAKYQCLSAIHDWHTGLFVVSMSLDRETLLIELTEKGKALRALKEMVPISPAMN